MQVNFTFDKAAIERRSHTLEDVHRAVKSLFAVHDLPCVSDGDTLSFKDKGRGDDFACMWDIILSLLRSEWFMDCAAVCVWQDKGGEVKMNRESNRLQVFFHEKPDRDTCSVMRHSDFKWAPSVGAWQRQLTDNAIYAAKHLDCLRPLSGERPAPDQHRKPKHNTSQER